MSQKLKTETGNVKVMVRVRPFNKREAAFSESLGKPVQPIISVNGPRVAVLDPDNFQERDAFEYDHVFWSVNDHESSNGHAEQTDVYEKTGKVMLQSALEGYNCCIFAYGQTGSGKTYTMLGSAESRGVSYLLIEDLFRYIEKSKEEDPGTMYTTEVSFMEIYNEQVRDLFSKKANQGEYSPIKIRQDPVKGILVQGLIQVPVRSAAECAKEMERGVNERALAETKMNATSSRSHAICQISVLQANPKTGLRRNSLINLVDLAGSERLKMSGVEGAAAKEAKNINLSLSTLRKVFDTLIANSKKKNPKSHEVPPYRESMLTWVLKESLGGNSKTMMIAAISPHEENTEDTISTLRYALKAKSIVCKVICNEQPSAKMVENLKDQVENLRAQLAEKATGLTEGARHELEKRYEEEIRESQEALQEAQKVEEQMEEAKAHLEAEVEKLEEQKQEMRTHIDQQKRQKFAAAFRSAFVIKKEKGEVSTIKMELKELQVSLNELRVKHRSLDAENRDLRKILQDKQASYTREITTVQRQMETYRANSVQVDSDLLDTQLKRKELEFQNHNLQQQLHRQEETTLSLQREVHKLAACNEAVQRNNAVLESSVREQLEDALRANDELERKKNAYKKQCASLEAKLQADEEIIQRLKGDKRRYQTNINAGMTAQRAAELAVETVTKRAEADRVRTPQGSGGGGGAAPAGSSDSIASLLGNLRDFRAASEEWSSQARPGSPQRGYGSPQAWQHQRGVGGSPSPLRTRFASLSPTSVMRQSRVSSRSPM